MAKLKFLPHTTQATASHRHSVCSRMSTHLVGYHASAAKGVFNAVLNAVAAGARAFAFFTRSSRSWTCPELKAADAAMFRELCCKHGFSSHSILPHGTYLSNSGSGDASIRQKSIAAIKDELKTTAALGLTLYNFHPGSATNGISRQQCCENVAAAIDDCCGEIPGVTLVIETMAGQGGTIGSSLEELRDIIALVSDKSRVGLCVDTAHVHAAGYDIRTAAGWDAYMRDFDAIVGLGYLRGMHLNDSKVALGSRVDRHESIGHGHIGLEAFRAIMNDPRTAGLPLILETPGVEGNEQASIQKYAKEIQLLYSLQGGGPAASVASSSSSSASSFSAPAASAAAAGIASAASGASAAIASKKMNPSRKRTKDSETHKAVKKQRKL